MKPMERDQSVNQLVKELVEGRMLMNTLKEKIAKAITEYVNLDDTYTYKLTRVKSAFFVGTLDLDDFEEWSETDVDELTEAIVSALQLQLQLTENQQAVLDGLKFIFINYNQEFDTDGGIKYALRDFYWYLGTDYSLLENKKLVSMCESYYTLSADKFAQVLEVFSRWTQEQEEE